jgi:hypothetical protein
MVLLPSFGNMWMALLLPPNLRLNRLGVTGFAADPNRSRAGSVQCNSIDSMRCHARVVCIANKFTLTGDGKLRHGAPTPTRIFGIAWTMVGVVCACH